MLKALLFPAAGIAIGYYLAPLWGFQWPVGAAVGAALGFAAVIWNFTHK